MLLTRFCIIYFLIYLITMLNPCGLVCCAPSDLEKEVPLLERIYLPKWNFPLTKLPFKRENKDWPAIGETVLSPKQSELQSLLEELYKAQVAVKLESGEISRAQEVAMQTKEALGDANGKVRILNANLRAAQEEALQATKQAQAAQLLLMTHDQLLFEARTRADAISTKILAVETQLASDQGKYTTTSLPISPYVTPVLTEEELQDHEVNMATSPCYPQMDNPDFHQSYPEPLSYTETIPDFRVDFSNYPGYEPYPEYVHQPFPSNYPFPYPMYPQLGPPNTDVFNG